MTLSIQSDPTLRPTHLLFCMYFFLLIKFCTIMLYFFLVRFNF